MSVRAVYDTMIFLQIASRPGRVHASYQAARDGRVELCVSPALLAEVQDVLSRPRVLAKFPTLTPQTVEIFLAHLLESATLFHPVPAAFTWPLHPDDDHIFNLAIHSRARFLVTWERRILNLMQGASVASSELRRLAPELRILTPTDFIEALQSQPPGEPAPEPPIPP